MFEFTCFLKRTLVADYLNFKVNFLASEISQFQITWIQYFQNLNVSEAVQQFSRHMSVFKRAIGPPELEFEHWGWIAKQCAFDALYTNNFQ